jgi:hypothetical protein
VLGGAPRSRRAAALVGAESTKDQFDELLPQWCGMPDLSLCIDAESHDEAQDLWLMGPPQTIALTADRKVVLDRSRPAMEIRHDVICLPSFANPITAHVTPSASLCPHKPSFRRCETLATDGVGREVLSSTDRTYMVVFHGIEFSCAVKNARAT